tara:strand:- start:13293 stop:14291 length:999 start_codon:yes stop_codon:yes gene_type:complete
MTPFTFKALVAEEIKGEFTQSIQTVSSSQLPDHDVLIQVHYSSLNYKDMLSATGQPGITDQYPLTPGIDASGIVFKSSDKRFKEGDKVIVTSYDLGMNTPGGFGNFISVPGDWIVPLPEHLSLRESMMIGTSGLTAAMGVHKILNQGIQPSDGEVVVTGSTGAVGSFAIALLSKLGFKVTAITGKTDESTFLHSIGADKIVSRFDLDLQKARPLLSSKWIAGVDCVGGDLLDYILRQTAHNGMITCCGNVAGDRLNTSIYPFILRGVSLHGIDSGIARMADRLSVWNKLSGEWQFNKEQICKFITLLELPDEIRKMQNAQQIGKVVIQLPVS